MSTLVTSKNSGSSSDLATSQARTSPILTLAERDKLKPATWPMPVDEFLTREYLQFSDVLLSVRKRHLLSWLIQTATKGNFSHAALVFLTPNWSYGWQSTYLIESVFSGVEVTDLRDYFKYSRMHVGIKRLKHPWFTPEIQRRVRGRMLDDIKAKYNFPLMIAMAEGLWFSIESSMRGHKRAVIRRGEKGRRDAPNEFICSGFVQRGFAQGIAEFIRENALPPSTLRQVIFDRDLAKLMPDDWSKFSDAERNAIIDDFLHQFSEELLGATPRDIETSAEFEWVYAVTDGLAYPVSTYREVCDILKLKPFKG